MSPGDGEEITFQGVAAVTRRKIEFPRFMKNLA